MGTKIGLIESSKFEVLNYPQILHDSFNTIVRNGVEYKQLFAFEHYIKDYPFELVFDTMNAYETWAQKGVDKRIKKAEYDWTQNKALITIADPNFPGPHEFECTTTWTEVDCQAAINNKFPN
ncbi:MAG: hypothetical protein N4A71_05660 [Carboxylicivirga sp.]|jgi:hypothetical protein|nr:hypothetical protein [Carboxylicivirga sp.]